MAKVDRDLEAIIEFCKNFNSNLQSIESAAGNLQSIGSQIESSLYNTKFATNASGTVGATAKKVISAVQQGEERIRQIQRRAEQQLAEREQFER